MKMMVKFSNDDDDVIEIDRSVMKNVDVDVIENLFFNVYYLLFVVMVVMVKEHERMKMMEFSNDDDDVIDVDQ
jgi:hypothetical protein